MNINPAQIPGLIQDMLVQVQAARISIGVVAWFDLGRPATIEEGDTGAHHLLRAVGHLTEIGGLPLDASKARRFLLKAESHPKYRVMALTLRHAVESFEGGKFPQDPGGLAAWLEQSQRYTIDAAEAGDLHALTKLVACDFGGKGSFAPVSAEPFLAKFPDIAPEAIARAGVARCELDPGAGEALFIRAIKMGSIGAYWDVAGMLKRNGRTEDASAMMAQGAARGNPHCCLDLAKELCQDGPPKDMDLALRYAYVAAHQGLVEAMALYGLLLFESNPAHPDCQSALLVGGNYDHDFMGTARAAAKALIPEEEAFVTAYAKGLNWHADQVDETRWPESVVNFGDIWAQLALQSPQLFESRPAKV
jgi:hypothetical protein